MSNSVRPHRRQPTRLLHPWDSPGKNAGVCCHFLLQCMKVKSESEVAQLCPTLSDSMDCSPPGSSVHGIFLEEYWGGLSFLPPGDLPKKLHDAAVSYYLLQTQKQRASLKSLWHWNQSSISELRLNVKLLVSISWFNPRFKFICNWLSQLT